MRVCSVDGCELSIKSRGWCNLHYLRWWKYGDPLAVWVAPGECGVDGCNRPHRARGFCTAHYQRHRQHGDAMAWVPVSRCKVCGHPESQSINARILSGEPYRVLGQSVGLSRTAIARHATNHLGLSKPNGAPATCRVCADPRLDEIDAALDQGVSQRSVGREFGYSPHAIRKHLSVDHAARLASDEAARLTAVRRYVA